MVHCFTESADEAQAFVDIGLDIGITEVMRRKLRMHKATASSHPLDAPSVDGTLVSTRVAASNRRLGPEPPAKANA